MGSKKTSKSAKKTAEPSPETELTPKQLKEKKREEARARAAEARKIVTAGTTAWTGKLPAQLLNENCQKLKWQAVEYSTRGNDEAFTAIAYLSKKNPKTGQVTKVKFEPPKDLYIPQKTPLEARHYTATYVLHRILSARNLKMMLPPAHRDVWIDLDKIKAEAPKHDQWMWEDDPFAAWETHKKEVIERQASHKARQEAAPMKQAIQAAKSTIKQESQDNHLQEKRIRFACNLQMSKELRAKTEALLQARHGFKFQKSEVLDNTKKSQITKVVSDLGFAQFQVKEAFEYVSTLSDCLTWLLIHVPEDDLPKLFTPQHLDQSVRVASNMATESAISRVKDFGFSEQVAIRAVKDCGTLAASMVSLTNNLIGAPIATTNEQDDEFWNEEIESLKAIYDGVETFTEGCSWKLSNGVKIYFYRSRGYPACCPGIGLEPPKKTPKYILLDAIRRTAAYAQDLLGDYMMLSLAQWLDDSFDNIVKSPCKLIEISAGISGIYEAKPSVTSSTPLKKRGFKKRRALDPEVLLSEHENKFDSADGRCMLEARAALPAWNKKEEICELVNNHSVVLITGETGSGKSTQVVQFLLDEAIKNNTAANVNIICTQPRRISAIGVAQRVADERLTPLGEQVGYVIRGERKASDSTMISFLTSGVLLRMIQTDALEFLNNVSHIVIDEVHERSLDSDFLLILLRRVLSKVPTLKVILMSATVDPVQFMDYFKPVSGPVGYTHIEGRTFPVTKIYLDEVLTTTQYVPRKLSDEGVTSDDLGQIITSMRVGVDYAFVSEVVKHIHGSLGKENGSILIFMSGAAEIDRTISAINSLSCGNEFLALPLHASLPPSDQRLVFNTAPKGKRKVVVSTNVAETSITISDIVAVIDSGRVKETLFNPESHVIKLVDSWASQAAVAQRMGRAGRVRAGTCYKLYTKNIETEKMIPRPAPEMLRCSLDSLYLAVKAMGISNVEKFLSSALDPPPELSISVAKSNLAKYGALTSTGDLTPLGKHISLLPLDPQSGKLLILSVIFGCLPRGLTVAAILGGKPPLVSPKEKRDEAKTALKAFAEGGCGDLLAYVRAFEQWTENSKIMSKSELGRWCSSNFVSVQACRDIQSTKRQLLGNLMQSGMVDTDKEDQLCSELRCHDKSDTLLCAIIGGSLSPRIVEAVYPHKEYITTSTGSMEAPRESHRYLLLTPSGERVFLHPGSSSFGDNNLSPYLSYGSSIATTKHFISSVAPLTTYGLLFFCNNIQVDVMGAGIIVDKWTGLKCWPRIGILGKFLKILFDRLIESKFENPNVSIHNNEVVNCVLELIESGGRE